MRPHAGFIPELVVFYLDQRMTMLSVSIFLFGHVSFVRRDCQVIHVIVSAVCEECHCD